MATYLSPVLENGIESRPFNIMAKQCIRHLLGNLITPGQYIGDDGPVLESETLKFWAFHLKALMETKSIATDRKGEEFNGGIAFVEPGTGTLDEDDTTWLRDVIEFFETAGDVEQL